MTKTVSAFSRFKEALQCSQDISNQILEDGPLQLNALIVFASPQLDLPALLKHLQEQLNPRILVGCSSAGEFAVEEFGVESASVLAIHSDEIELELCLGTGINKDVARAAEEFGAPLLANTYRLPHRYVLVLADALAGHTEEFLAKVTEFTAGAFQLFGGGAGDDEKFQQTYVFAGSEIYQNAAVGLALFSPKPLGIGVRHGWVPASERMRVTESDGFELISLNAEPALDVLVRHAEQNGQSFDVADPLPFFLHNVFGVETTTTHKVRVPLGITEKGGVVCATAIPVGATVQIMKSDGISAVQAAETAAATALEQVGNAPPAGVLFFDCVATRLRLGTQFGAELAAVRNRTAPAAFVGCNSYGQVARIDGQFSGFHNCTAVVCVIPA